MLNRSMFSISALARSRPTRIPTARTGKTYLVTGGHGMLGSHLVEALLARGEDRVRIFDFASSPLFADEVRRGQVTFHQGDLRDTAQVAAACKGVDTVFHAAANVAYWADLPFELGPIHAVNVTGTENLVATCIATGVSQLVSTSSASVVIPHDVLNRPIVLGDESLPLASPPYLCHYIRTKVAAERAVLDADSRGGLRTAALRPGGMYGPRDQLITRSAVQGIPGMSLPTTVIDYIYVENVAHAFLLLERHLVHGEPVCGQAYFVTNYPPDMGSESSADFYNRFAARFNHRFFLLPEAPVSALAGINQALVRVTGGRARLGELGKVRPASLTLARATYYFSHRRATKDFGYSPLYSVDEAMDLTAAHCRQAVQSR